MNDQSDNSQGQQPTHEAARVVIPFDIDMTIVDRKIEELERRVKAITGGTQINAQTPSQQESRNSEQTDIRDRQLLVVTLSNMQNYLRTINDTIQLIQSDLLNGKRS
jgi:hypothetical protein